MSTSTPAQQVSLAKPKEIWNTMPGWGIVANLTPHELIVARRIQSIRKYLIIGLVALVLVLGGLYGWAWSKSNAATTDLNAEQDRSTMLSAQQSKYGAVTKLQHSIDTIGSQIATLMTADVDMSGTVAAVRAALPDQMSLNSITVTISKASVSVGNKSNGTTPGSLNTTGHQVIGNIVLIGRAPSIDAVARYVTALRKVDGITDVIPTSNSGSSGNFNISLSLTDVVLSHRFDVKDGSK